MPAKGRDFFTYRAEFLPLGALASVTVNVPIQADSDFQLTEITGDVRVLVTDETVVAAPATLVTIQDSGTGRLLMDGAILWTNIVGTAQRPFILPMPKEIRASSVIAVTLSDLSGNARNLRMAFVGYKIFV
jgi:hypothetical protein